MGAHKGGDAPFSLGSQGVSETAVLVHLVTRHVAFVAGTWGRQPSIQCMCCEPVLPLGELLVQ